MAEKQSTSFRLTPRALQLLAAVAKQEGIDKTDVMELLIRRRAEELKIQEEETA